MEEPYHRFIELERGRGGGIRISWIIRRSVDGESIERRSIFVITRHIISCRSNRIKIHFSNWGKNIILELTLMIIIDDVTDTSL